MVCLMGSCEVIYVYKLNPEVKRNRKLRNKFGCERLKNEFALKWGTLFLYLQIKTIPFY